MDNRKISNIEQLCSVYEYERKSGKAKGETVIEINNGILSFSLTPDSGLDIYSMRHRGTNIAFISKNGMIENSMNGSFAERFCGGFLYTCGIDSIGIKKGYSQHGRFHSTPAERVKVYNDGQSVKIEGCIESTTLFGSCLKTCRTIETRHNSGKIYITDVIKNEGYKLSDFILLYHFNIGYPMLDEDVKIKADIAKTIGLNAFAENDKADALTMCAPKLDEEMVFCHTLNGDCAEISVINEKINKQINFRYSNSSLPHFIEWKSMQAGDYALGIEPATSSLLGKRQYSTLMPGEEKVFRIVVNICETEI